MFWIGYENSTNTHSFSSCCQAVFTQSRISLLLTTPAQEGGWGCTARTAGPTAHRNTPYCHPMAPQQGKLVGKQGYHCSGTGKALLNCWQGINFVFHEIFNYQIALISVYYFSHSPFQLSLPIPLKRERGNTCVVLNYVRIKPQQQIMGNPNYVFPFLPSRCVILTLFTVQGWFFCFILSILPMTPSVLFTFPRTFLTERDVTGEVVIAFLGSGVFTCVLSPRTLARMGGREKKANFNTKACLHKCTCWKTSCNANHCSPHNPHLWQKHRVTFSFILTDELGRIGWVSGFMNRKLLPLKAVNNKMWFWPFTASLTGSGQQIRTRSWTELQLTLGSMKFIILLIHKDQSCHLQIDEATL